MDTTDKVDREVSYLLRISGRYTRSLGAVHDPQAAARSPIGCVLVALLVSDVDVMTSVQLQRLPSRSPNKISAPSLGVCSIWSRDVLTMAAQYMYPTRT